MKKIAVFLVCMFLLPALCQARDIPSLDQPGLVQLLEKNRGKIILINFFATWCPPCKAEIPEIVKVRDKFPADKLMIIGLSVDDSVDPVGPFLEQTGVNYPVYMADKDVSDAFAVSSVPHNAFIGKDGKVIISEPGMADTKVLSQVIEDLLKMGN